MDILYIFLIYSINIYIYIYIYFLNMFHIFSLVCSLIYGVKSRSGHDRSKMVPLSAELFKLHCGLNNSDSGHVRTFSWLHNLRNTQGKIYGAYLGNIYGIYMEYIRNIQGISIDIYDQKHRPIGAPPKAAPVFLITLYHKYLCIFLIYSLYIPYLFPQYAPYIFPCVFLHAWSQE